ncbi:Riboflavin synthase-like beta-barrel [Pseudocohnilembus persalinus]|uniref:NADH-cytochrome b5 reductase n=1 Tax=Pseudocohnilembus persalinus TaxID=266149 RepID=A0A0V0R2K2_PSEPJ|nr:Riboflavin synthase-like beta-barrel [Pseudocohnilembus persalinus]|eukprot:KRX08766.1 Riboflavin synthase-like beta-barrel [Pseudocohnilembus persalinus]
MGLTFGLNSLIITGSIILITSIAILSFKMSRSEKSLLNSKKKTQKQKVTLTKKTQISPDTYQFSFSFKPGYKLGIQNGQHIKIYLQNENGLEISRNYTPITPVETSSHFDLVIKIYRANVHPDFPEGGLFTQLLDKLEIGSQIDISGPVGILNYQGNGKISYVDNIQKPQTYKNIIMVAGGTGITPMFQILQAIKNNVLDKTEISLLYVNRHENDILLRKELEYYKNTHNLHINLSLTQPSQEWNQLKGRISEEMIRSLYQDFITQNKQDDTIVLYCGPQGFNKGARTIFKQLGFKNLHTF